MPTDSVIDRWLRNHAAWWAAGAVLLVSLATLSLNGSGVGPWLIVAIFCVLVAALAASEPAEDWKVIVGLALLGAGIRAAAHAALVAWTSGAGGPFLGPDSSTYYFRSVVLAQDHFAITASPALHFGTYDAAHYYLFAGIVTIAGPDLISLQTANWVMTALAGPLAWAIARRVVPTHAHSVALLVAVYPSIIAVSVNDLLKDPSVIAASLVAAWAIVRLLADADRPSTRLVIALLGGGALAYVHMSRFYVAAFLLGATLVGLAIAAWRARRGTGPAIATAGIAAALGIFVVAEGVPKVMGWPFSPVMVAEQFAHVMNTPGMRLYSPGLLARLTSSSGEGSSMGAEAPASLPGTGPSLEASAGLTHSGRDILALTRDRASARSTGLPHTTSAGVPMVPKPKVAAPSNPPVVAPPVEEPPPGNRVVRWATNGIRKLFGPFPWVPPPDYSPRTITLGDYLLFPGMFVWYAVFPIALVAMLVVAGDTLRGRAGGFSSGMATFTGALLVLYLGLNLSWRQREFMFPFLALLAFWAIDRVSRRRWARYAYALYWCGIVLLAVTHTAVRAWAGRSGL